ncbi:hypothetical protein RHGRI_023726 [Rhododendron griersonianum]|uniref:Uncharacterized protein n=1 Tax=Rhododendron griersonianum TaxID=479676 RepID=A0AAV6J4E9_9ERIC|nr:hypothetical protein RHGRI_023726 [Rhododendron griersonianum]
MMLMGAQVEAAASTKLTLLVSKSNKQEKKKKKMMMMMKDHVIAMSDIELEEHHTSTDRGVVKVDTGTLEFDCQSGVASTVSLHKDLALMRTRSDLNQKKKKNNSQILAVGSVSPASRDASDWSTIGCGFHASQRVVAGGDEWLDGGGGIAARTAIAIPDGGSGGIDVHGGGKGGTARGGVAGDGAKTDGRVADGMVETGEGVTGGGDGDWRGERERSCIHLKP